MVEKKDIDVSKFPPATCKRCKTMNDPYPETGRCKGCGSLLPGNPYRIAVGDDMAERKSVQKKDRDRRAQRYIEEAGFDWKEVGTAMQDLAKRAAKTRDRHDMSFLMEQLETRKARPKAQDAHIDAEFIVVLSGETIDALEESLGVLTKLARK